MNGAVKKEITLALYAVEIGVNVSQIAVLPMPAWAHALVLGVSGALAAVINRAMVTPNVKIGA